MTMTWDDIYEQAIDTACGDPALQAKDEARWNVRNLMMKLGCDDLEKEDCPEDKVDDYCVRLRIRFNERGDIISLSLPAYLKDYIKFE